MHQFRFSLAWRFQWYQTHPYREEIHFAQPGWRFVVFRRTFHLYEDVTKKVWSHTFLSGSQIMTSTPISTPNMIYSYEQNDFWNVKMEWQGWLGEFQWGLVKTNKGFVNTTKSATKMCCPLLENCVPLTSLVMDYFFLQNVKLCVSQKAQHVFNVFCLVFNKNAN